MERLYRIQALRRLGFSLRAVGELLQGRTARPLTDVISEQLDQIRGRILAERQLEQRLMALQQALSHREQHTDVDLLEVIGRMTMIDQRLRHDYTKQAERYDRSRGAAPSVLVPLRAALAGSPGADLLDIGGGTGNYAAAFRTDGWNVTVVDVSEQMRQQAAAKGLRAVPGDATALPFRDESYDAAMMVSMLHQVEDWRGALREARRVLRPAGKVAIMGLTADHLEQVTWAFDLFPSMRAFALRRRPSLAEMTAELPGARVEPLWFTDLQDASIAALCAHPEAMLDERFRRQTSFFERLERDNPAELASGLAELRAQLERGESPLAARKAARDRLGDACVIIWQKP